jgi:uncharacterized membrane protein affecting hemolysin expression
MDSGYSTVRNLLYLVLVLVVLAILSNFYTASQLARNSDELASLRQLLAKQVMGSAMGEAQELQKRMDALNESTSGIDAKLRKAQDDFVARMDVELPRIIDNYVKQRMPVLEKQLEKRGAAMTKP